MSLRVAGLWSHPNSKMWWFRMGVPERYRERVRKLEWKESLGTTDEGEARIRHARKLLEKREIMERLDASEVLLIDDRADKIVSDGFDALAASNAREHADIDGFDIARGMDNVSYAMLRMMGFRARLDWGGDYAAKAQRVELRTVDPELWPKEEPNALGAFPSYAHRDAASTAIDLFESQKEFEGAAFREIARGYLAAREWSAAAFEAQIVAQATGVVLKPKGPLFESIAERILRRLADHRFAHWPSGVDHVLSPIITAMAAHLPDAPSSPSTPQPEAGTPISVVFKAWRNHTKATPKSQDEFASSIERFQSVFGDMAVEAITKPTVLDFRRIMESLPYRPKKGISVLPLRDQVALAAAKGMRIVSPETATKNLQALRTTLLHARDEMLLIDHNPAEGVRIDRSDSFDDNRLAFNGEQLRTLFELPIMTDAEAPKDNAIFWFMLLAPLTGCRCSELATLRPANIRQEDGVWYIAIERDPKRRRLEEEAEGKSTKRVKTRTSLRNIPVHWLAQEAGFLDLVEQQRAAGAEWVFDGLRTYEKYGDRGKDMSRKLMTIIRGAGIADLEYVFHSFRHSLKGRLRDDPETKEEISDLLTGHSFLISVGRKYARGAGLKILSEAVQRVEYHTIDWDPVVACGKSRVG